MKNVQYNRFRIHREELLKNIVQHHVNNPTLYRHVDVDVRNFKCLTYLLRHMKSIRNMRDMRVLHDT